jgi:hypothetical protein
LHAVHFFTFHSLSLLPFTLDHRIATENKNHGVPARTLRTIDRQGQGKRVCPP